MTDLSPQQVLVILILNTIIGVVIIAGAIMAYRVIRFFARLIRRRGR